MIWYSIFSPIWVFAFEEFRTCQTFHKSILNSNLSLNLGFHFMQLEKYEIDFCSTGLFQNYTTNNGEPECLMKCLQLTQKCSAYSFNTFTNECRATSCSSWSVYGNSNSSSFFYGTNFFQLLFLKMNEPFT